MSEADQLEDEIRFYSPDPALPVLSFPDWECLPYDVFSPHQELVSQRLSTLYRLPRLTRGVVLAAVSTLLYRLVPREYVAGHSLLLSTGERLDLEPFREQLVQSGYHAVSQVMEPGEYAVRGGLVDLYPVGAPRPYRIDLFGDTVESIREFDPETQRSGQTLPSVQLLPAREYPLTEAAIQRFRQAFRARFEGDPQKVGIYRDVSKGIAPAGVEFFLPLFFERTASIFDYLPNRSVCVLADGAEQAAADFLREARGRYEQLRYDVERPLLAPEELFIDVDAFRASLSDYACVELRDFSAGATAGGDVVDYGRPRRPSCASTITARSPTGA